ncbi:MAG: 8-oxoguanine DNA glycosylase [Clostridia bacterium]|nr:8-oxoguanine DNA glycosylase [Clostridia bacterium]
MREQEIVLSDIKDFELRDIFDCGQCFRWNLEDDGSYTGVIRSGVLNVKKVNNDVLVKGVCDGDLREIVFDYFDLERDYGKIKKELSKIDDNMKKSVEYGSGIRILNQDLWECIISFIISANNNIPRIKGIIERISKRCGKRVEFEGKDYYLFPNVDELSSLTVKDLRDLGLGFRDKRVHKTCEIIKSGEVSLERLESLDDSDLIREELLKLDGVGEKVADCISLFSLKRYDVFPVDVWVRRVMNDLYIKNEDETKVNKREIRKVAEDLFGDMAGLAQQYLFYWRREN